MILRYPPRWCLRVPVMENSPQMWKLLEVGLDLAWKNNGEKPLGPEGGRQDSRIAEMAKVRKGFPHWIKEARRL